MIKYILILIAMAAVTFFGCYYNNGYMFIGFLACICIGNVLREKDEDGVWNNGICKKYNEPWIHTETIEHLELFDYIYKCRDQFFIVTPRSSFLKDAATQN